MNDREQRDLQIVAKCRIDKTGDFYLVPSQSKNGKDVVHLNDDSAHCSCPDHETSGVECKHIHAVRYRVDREQNPDGTETVTETVGDSIHSKTDTAMVNNVLAKFVCHNICCVIQSIIEYGVEPSVWAELPVTQQVGQH